MEKNELKLVLDEAWQYVVEEFIKVKSELEYKMFWYLGEKCLVEGLDESGIKKMSTKTRKDVNWLLDGMRAVAEYKKIENMMSTVGTKPLRVFRGEKWPRPPVTQVKCGKCGRPLLKIDSIKETQ